MTSADHPLCDPHSAEHSVKIFTGPRCGYCIMAKRLLLSRGISFEEIETQGHPEVRSWLAQITHQYTVPQVFIHGKSIGGYTELSVLDRAGQLMKLVNVDQD